MTVSLFWKQLDMNEEDILRIIDELLLKKKFYFGNCTQFYISWYYFVNFVYKMYCSLFCFRKSGPKRKSSMLWLYNPKKKKASHISTPNLKKDETLLPSSTKLLRALSKRKLKSQLKQNRKLFQYSEQEQLIDEMVELIPTVMKKLQKEKLVVDICQLLRLINEEKLPLQNIALHLLFDVVRWYSVDYTSKMFYPDSCMKFWKVMYRLFHGKVLI
jgi:hypothetical protein